MIKRAKNFHAYNNRVSRFLGENAWAGYTVVTILAIAMFLFVVFLVSYIPRGIVFIIDIMAQPFFIGVFSALCIAFSVLFSLCIACYLLNLLISGEK